MGQKESKQPKRQTSFVNPNIDHYDTEPSSAAPADSSDPFGAPSFEGSNVYTPDADAPPAKISPQMPRANKAAGNSNGSGGNGGGKRAIPAVEKHKQIDRAEPDEGYMAVSPVYENAKPVEPKNTDDTGYMAVDPAWLEEQNRLMQHEPWFRGVYSRQEALRELSSMPIGGFVVRVSSQPGHYAISCNFGYKVENMLILPSWDPQRKTKGETVYRLGSMSMTFFGSVVDLIHYYSVQPFFQDEFGAKHILRLPETNQNGTDGYLDVRGHPDVLAQKKNAGNARASVKQAPKQEALYDTASPYAATPFVPTTSVDFDSRTYDLAEKSQVEEEDSSEEEEGGGYLSVDPNENTYDNKGDEEQEQEQEAAPTGAASGASILSDIGDSKVIAVYRELFKIADASSLGAIGAGDAVTFFRRSGLQDGDLGSIWAIADKSCNGFLTETEFFVALKLVALAQNGIEPAMENLRHTVPLPEFGDVSRKAQQRAGFVGMDADYGEEEEA